MIRLIYLQSLSTFQLGMLLRHISRITSYAMPLKQRLVFSALCASTCLLSAAGHADAPSPYTPSVATYNAQQAAVNDTVAALMNEKLGAPVRPLAASVSPITVPHAMSDRFPAAEPAPAIAAPEFPAPSAPSPSAAALTPPTPISISPPAPVPGSQPLEAEVRPSLQPTPEEQAQSKMAESEPPKKPDVTPLNLAVDSEEPKTVQSTLVDFVPPSPPVDSAANANAAIRKALEAHLQTLERENQAMRAKLNMDVADNLKDIEVDAVSKIHEDVLRARISELEHQVDKLNMKDDSALPQKTSPDHDGKTPKNPKS